MRVFRNIEYNFHERVMLLANAPAQVTAGTRAFVQQVEPCNSFAVNRLAGELADAIAFEGVSGGRAMADVMSRQSAMLEELIAWIERHGVDARALHNCRRSTLQQ